MFARLSRRFSSTWNSHAGSKPRRWYSSTKKETVVVGMSGGVDSAVAALLLKDRGFRVVGVHMQNWDPKEEKSGKVTPGSRCPEEEDWREVESVCRQLEIESHQVRFVREYWLKVFEPSIQEYSSGFTPNPDVLCNREIKFDAFLRYAIEQHGADFVATGHYARLKDMPGGARQMLRAVDPEKDQTYFLSAIKPEFMSRILFPIGDLKKGQVRQMARDAGLSNADRRSSAGICFIGRRDFGTFLQDYIEPQEGVVRDAQTGTVVGKHKGHAFYTIGQRLRLSGARQAWVVAKKLAATNELLVCSGTDSPLLYTNAFDVEGFCFIAPGWIPGQPMRGECRIRHPQHQLYGCTATVMPPLHSVRVELSHPQRAIAPGQNFVFYHGDLVVGGGRIASVDPSLVSQQVPSQ